MVIVKIWVLSSLIKKISKKYSTMFCYFWLDWNLNKASWQVVVLQRYFYISLLGRALGRSLLTGGRYSEVIISTGLTVSWNYWNFLNFCVNCIFMSADCHCRRIVCRRIVCWGIVVDRRIVGRRIVGIRKNMFLSIGWRFFALQASLVIHGRYVHFGLWILNSQIKVHFWLENCHFRSFFKCE